MIPLEISNCYLARAIVCVCFGEKNAISEEKEFGPEIPKKKFTKEDATAILEKLPDDPSDKMGNLFSYFCPTIIFIIFWDFLMFYQIFLSPQVKRWAIITYKHGIYQLPHELPNDLRLRK